MRVRVREPYAIRYPDPIKVSAGAAVTVGRRDEQFTHWLWCRAEDGREGWVPERLLSSTNPGRAHLKEAYEATELPLAAGERVELVKEFDGFGWGECEDGRAGWFPMSVLERISGKQTLREPFDLQPTLQSTLITLRPLREEDFPVLFAVASDPLIWEQHPEPDRYTHEKFTIYFRDAMQSGGALIAIDNATGQVIGSSRFHGYDEAKREVEIGWTFLARSHWGGRYNGEMKQLMLTHAFRFVDSVVFLIGPHNVRSQQAVLKIVAVRDGSRTDASGRESWVYRLTAESFKTRHSAGM